MDRVTPLRADSGRKACYKSKIISFTRNRMLHCLQQHNLLNGRFITGQAVDNGNNGCCSWLAGPPSDVSCVAWLVFSIGFVTRAGLTLLGHDE
jgi:hypothetical protein